MALAAGRWIPIAIAAVGLPFALSAFAWIDAPTRDGRAMLDRIAGFKQYLSITERDRLDRMQAPEDNLQLFERYLPYAIALEVENRWADRFTSILAAASAAASASGRPPGFGWYSGSSSPWTDTGGIRRVDRRFAVERGVVGLDRARIVERIGRRGFVGWRRRRRWRRRLVISRAARA